LPYQATDSLRKDPAVGTTTTTATHLPIKYIWERSIEEGGFSAIPGATNENYLPGLQMRDTRYRRIAIVNQGMNESYDISNAVSIARKTCTRPTTRANEICGDQEFYNLKDGDIISPTKILGSYIPWSIHLNRIQGYELEISYDQINWTGLGRQQMGGPSMKPKDYALPDKIFNISNGNIQYIYYRRVFYENYDEWSCKDPFGFPHPCIVPRWYLNSISNTVTLTLTSLNPPKEVADSITNETGFDKASCIYDDQTMVFSVPRVDNNETYKWEIPDGWVAYTALEGPYVNSITVSANSSGANYAKGGNVCLTIKQAGQVSSMCRFMQGSEPFSVNLPRVLTGCEGSDIVVTPVVLKNNVSQSVSEYRFNWEAYQAARTECISEPTGQSSGCRQLKITIGNVYQNPVQQIKVTAINDFGCTASATTNLTTVPGLQMGLLNSFEDPKVSSTSNLTLNEYSNQLYFTGANGTIQRAYFDDNVNQNIWRYAELKDKNTNDPIRATGSLTFYRDAVSDKLFYVNGGSIYYAETTDNGVTWTNYASSAFVGNVDTRIKINGNNIYYIDAVSKKIFIDCPHIVK
jgi:hypothetical protein